MGTALFIWVVSEREENRRRWSSTGQELLPIPTIATPLETKTPHPLETREGEQPRMDWYNGISQLCSHHWRAAEDGWGRAQMHLEHFHLPQFNVSPITAGDALVIETTYV